MIGESQSEWEEEIETQLEKRCWMGVIDTCGNLDKKIQVHWYIYM